jgi:threonine/homoserine/homoserine lactone efflux protein
MPPLPTLLLFAAATAGLLLVPGPSVLFIVARTLEHGRRGGLISMLGVETGALCHVAAATAGLGALVATSPDALHLLKLAGAAYLIALGWRALRRPHGLELAPAGPGALFRQGLIVDLLNPKTALFFLAFLPQFIDPASGPIWTQTLTLGLVFVALATLTDGLYALVAGAFVERLRRRRKTLSRVSAAAYAGLGALAVS